MTASHSDHRAGPPAASGRALRVAALVSVGLIAIALSGAVATVQAATQVVNVTVTATPKTLTEVGGLAVWRITLKHQSGPIVGDTVAIAFDQPSVRFSSCTAACVPDPNGIDASWKVGPLSSRVTLQVTMLFIGGPGPIVGRVALADGQCKPACPVSATVGVARGPLSPARSSNRAE